MERSEVAAKLAERLGVKMNYGRRLDGGRVHRLVFHGTQRQVELVRFPPPDAPLHEHLAFVGRVLEALARDTAKGFIAAEDAMHASLGAWAAKVYNVHDSGAGKRDIVLAVALAVIDTPTKETP